MVHIFCLEEKCRSVIHLDSHKHWNFNGKVKCLKCGAEFEIEVEEGKLKSSRKSDQK